MRFFCVFLFLPVHNIILNYQDNQDIFTFPVKVKYCCCLLHGIPQSKLIGRVCSAGKLHWNGIYLKTPTPGLSALYQTVTTPFGLSTFEKISDFAGFGLFIIVHLTEALQELKLCKFFVKITHSNLKEDSHRQQKRGVKTCFFLYHS